jgi:hypothetical protein
MLHNQNKLIISNDLGDIGSFVFALTAKEKLASEVLPARDAFKAITLFLRPTLSSATSFPSCSCIQGNNDIKIVKRHPFTKPDRLKSW